MHWIFASLLSAFLLGWYDLSTKSSVRKNAVLPVLFFANLCSAGIWCAIMSANAAQSTPLPPLLDVSSLTLVLHLQLLLKSAIVACAWTVSYFAVKHLPVTLASPIRATGPIWTLCGALLILGERPTWLKGLGVIITLASFLGLSAVGAREGIHFRTNRWIWWLVAGTLLNGISALYDKFLLGAAGVFRRDGAIVVFDLFVAAFSPLGDRMEASVVDSP